MKKILVVGQTPPPYGGQAMMIHQLVKASFTKISIYHVRMAYSTNFKQVGKAGLYKIFHLISLVFKTIFSKYKYDIFTLYYVPAGPNLSPIIRDIIFLLCTRLFFKETIYHFHAAGLSDFIKRSNKLLKHIAFFAYKNPTFSIQLSDRNPADGKYLLSKRIEIIPNGLLDEYKSKSILRKGEYENNLIHILFVGVIQESKGIEDLIEAVSILKLRNDNIKVHVLGEFISYAYEDKIRNIVLSKELTKEMSFHGTKIGHDKYDVYRQVDIFCFPSFFESESFGNVILEAMMFELPVVATRWRGIPDIVDDCETGFLVNINSPIELADKLQILILQSNLRTRMGKNGRKKYLSHYTVEKHLQKMELALLQ